MPPRPSPNQISSVGIASFSQSYQNNSDVSRAFDFFYVYSLASGVQTFSITASKLCALQSVCTVQNTSVTQFFEQVRIRKIELLCNPPPDGTMVNISVSYPGTALGAIGNDRVCASTTVGMTVPAYVSLRPGPRNQAGDWQIGNTNNGTSTLFQLQVAATNPTASTNVTVCCKVHCCLRMTHDARTTNNTVTVASGILTGFYFLALDNPAGGVGSGGNLWVPDHTVVTTI
jgi:hypothetical protein